MLVLFGDTNSELWWERLETTDIKMINMPYILDGELKNADLGKNNDYIEFFDKIKKGVPASTCGLNKQNYIDYFEPYLSNGDDILYITFSHKMSNTFEFMNQAIDELKQKYPERAIDFVSTNQISIGESLILWEAYKLYKDGKTAKEIIDFVEKFSKEVVTAFVVDDLHHLKRGGRISGATAFLGSLLGIKPVLHISKEGKIEQHSKAHGKVKAMDYLVELLKNRGVDVTKYPIIVNHANEPQIAEKMVAKIREVVGDKAEIWVQPIGPTIGTHCGPGTFSISFHGEML